MKAASWMPCLKKVVFENVNNNVIQPYAFAYKRVITVIASLTKLHQTVFIQISHGNSQISASIIASQKWTIQSHPNIALKFA